MVGTVLIKMKVMPDSPDVNLEELKKEIIKIIEKNSGKNTRFEEEPIAFGLKALNTFFMLKEDLPLEPIELGIGEIQNVSSAQVADMRKAIE